MLVLRSEQMQAFERAARSQFESAMLAYIRQNVPSAYESLGEGGVCDCIRRGVDRARSYGASSEIATARIIELMLAFGSCRSSELGEWASRLMCEDSQDPDRTVEYIYRTATERGVVSGLLL